MAIDVRRNSDEKRKVHVHPMIHTSRSKRSVTLHTVLEVLLASLQPRQALFRYLEHFRQIDVGPFSTLDELRERGAAGKDTGLRDTKR